MGARRICQVCLILAVVYSAAAPSAAAAAYPAVGPAIAVADDLALRYLAERVIVVTHSFPWPANSAAVVLSPRHILLIDTPYTEEATASFLDWMDERYPGRTYTAIVTGFHFDNLGGSAELKRRGIPVWGSDRTAALIASNGERSRSLFLSWLPGTRNEKYRAAFSRLAYSPPDHTFPIAEGKSLVVGGTEVRIIFPGETHTPDNLAVLIPREKLLFGGCMLISGERVGNTEDANMATWADAVAKLGDLDFEVAIPGHGLRFDRGLAGSTLRALGR